ncbi:unnamed protein product [Withania somnifera]
MGLVSDAIQCFRLMQKSRIRFPFQGCTKVLEYFWNMGILQMCIFFNVMMSKLCKEGKMMEARSVFTEMWKRNLRPSVVSFNTLINGYCRLVDMDAGYKNFWMSDATELVKEMCVKGLVPNVIIFTTLISGHCKDGSIALAMDAYQLMPKQGSGDLGEARKLIHMMSENGLKPDKITYTTIVDGCCKEGDLGGAFKIKKMMVDNDIELDDAAYTALITGLCQQGRIVDAERILTKMLNAGLKPDDPIYTTVIDGFCEKGDMKMGFKLLRQMQSNGHAPNVITYNVLLNAMLNLGINPDDITYNILLEGLGNYGNPNDYDKLRCEMGLVHDYATYTSLVGSLCWSSRRQPKKSFM